METLWAEIQDLFNARVIWNDRDINWTVLCWPCNLKKPFLLHADAVNFCHGHSISAKHKHLVNS